MKYIDVEGTRFVTNDKHIAEQIKSDSTLPARECLLNRKVKSTVMDGVKSKRRGVKNIVVDGPIVGKLGKVGKEQKLKSVAMNGVKSGKFGKLENHENDDETMRVKRRESVQINHKRSRETQL